MSRVSELIDLISQGKNAEASEVLNSELMNRSYEGINALKPEVAQNFFSGVVGEPEETQEEPTAELESEETPQEESEE